jgi:probable phosphoglycerate mutase
MTLLLLVRHAVTDATGQRLSGTAPGIHLSSKGRQEAGRVAERLAGVPIAGVYSSPLERCVETAEPIAAARGLAVRPVPGLLEVDYGRWTGRSMPQLARTRMWRQLQEAPGSFTFPDGEALPDVQRRSVRAIEEIASRHPKALVAAVTHADVIRLLLAHFAGVHIDLFQRLIVSPVSISAVLLGDRIPRIVRMNDTGAIGDVLARASRRSERRVRARRPPGGSGRTVLRPAVGGSAGRDGT